jgi:hypothetical protein
MSETHSNNGELVPSMESAIPMEPGPSVQEPRNGDSSETSASKALASIVKFLGSEEEQSVTIKDVLQHMESLSTALTVNSRLLERNCTSAAADISPRSSGNVESQGSVPASLGTADTQNALEERKNLYKRLRDPKDYEYFEEECLSVLLDAYHGGDLKLRLSANMPSLEDFTGHGQFWNRVKEQWRKKHPPCKFYRSTRYWYPKIAQVESSRPREDCRSEESEPLKGYLDLHDPPPLGNIW